MLTASCVAVPRPTLRATHARHPARDSGREPEPAISASGLPGLLSLEWCPLSFLKARVLEGLVAATYTRNRGRILEGVNQKLDKLRLLFRHCAELQLLDQRRYEHALREIDEIGLVGSRARRARRCAERLATGPSPSR